MRTFLRYAPVTSLLIVVTLLAWVIAAVQAGSVTQTVWGSPLAESWILWGPFVAAEPLGVLRAVGAVFLHLDITHVVLNLIFLAYLGWGMERHLGSGVFAAIYLAGGLGSSAAVLWMDPATPTAGASGAIYALMAILVAFIGRRGGDLRAPLVLVGVNVAYTVLATGVSFWGHLGGLLAGALMAGAVTSPRRGVRWAGALIVLVGAVAAVLVRAWSLEGLGVSVD